MAHIWSALASVVATLAPPPQPPTPPPSEVVVESANQRIVPAAGLVEYSGGVKVVYGETTIRADRVTIHLDPSALGAPGVLKPQTSGLAEGHVQIDDPIGTMTASVAEFDWTRHTGKATDVVVKVDRVLLKAASATISENSWEFSDVTATTCSREEPLYLLHASRLTIAPGRTAIGRHLGLDLFGSRIASVPYMRVSLDNRVTDLTPPTLTLSESGKLGLASTNSFLLGPAFIVEAGVHSFPSERLRYEAQLVYSSVPARAATSLAAPDSELAERFKFGYFDNVFTRKPTDELAYVSSVRNAISVGTFWNVRPSGRIGHDELSKPWEIAYQIGGHSAGWSGLATARIQRIGILHDSWENRGAVGSTLEFPSWQLGPQLRTMCRLDGEALVGVGDPSGWGMANVGLIYSPLKDVNIGAALASGNEFGTARFASDRLYSRQALHLRGDWGIGPTKFSVLAKYDFSQRRWFDYEYYLSQITGCVEPFIVWRRFPDQFSFGIGLRADELFDRLKHRDFGQGTGR